jgi:hypothetical protein
MICFRDMTFCEAACGNVGCHRLLTPEVKAAAERWWPGVAPVARADFSATCPDFQPLSQGPTQWLSI